MSFLVEITEPAEQDAREAVRWIAQYAPEKASLWYFDFLEAADSLQEFPARCPIAPESSETRELRHLLCGKYRLIFLIDSAFSSLFQKAGKESRIVATGV